MNNILIILLSSVLGYNSHGVLSNFMLVGKGAVDYYTDAHPSKWDAFIHTSIMPYLAYGMLIWIPALLNLSPNSAKSLIFAIYYFYFGHYAKIDKLVAMLYFIQYYTAVRFSIKKWMSINKAQKYKNVKKWVGYYCFRSIITKISCILGWRWNNPLHRYVKFYFIYYVLFCVLFFRKIVFLLKTCKSLHFIF